MEIKETLTTGEIYHIYNKSISEFRIFNYESEFIRIINTIQYYQIEKPPVRLAQFMHTEMVEKQGFNKCFISTVQDKDNLVQIIAYCIMPTHIHLILKQLKEDGISIFMAKILNSYSRYFNTKHKRKGPLWEGRFKRITVGRDEQLLHLTRYIHLNPVTAHLVDKPEMWRYSSYREYISEIKEIDRVCRYEDILTIEPLSYREFVEERISYQRELAFIKKVALDNAHYTS